MPARHDSRVVLPQPDGPSSNASVPGWTSALNRSSGRMGYPPRSYSTATSCDANVAGAQGHQGPPNAVAGATLRGAAHADEPGQDADRDGEQRQQHHRADGDDDLHREPAATAARRAAMPTSDATTEMMTACRQMPAPMARC